MKFKEILKTKKLIGVAIIVVAIIAISLASLTVGIIRIAQRRKMEQIPLLTYDLVEENEDTGIFKILVKITSADGIETIKYKDSNNNEEMVLYCRRKKYSGNRLYSRRK